MIIYSGFLRTWDRCSLNHDGCLGTEAPRLFYTSTAPTSIESTHVQMQDQLMEYDVVLDTNRAPETSVINTLNQWRNRMAAFELVENVHPFYAIVRTDIVFSSPIIQFDPAPGRVYIPFGNDYRGGVNDQFAFGTYSVMQRYCNLYDHYRTYFDQGLVFHPESYLSHHLKLAEIEIVRLPITNKILRS